MLLCLEVPTRKFRGGGFLPSSNRSVYSLTRPHEVTHVTAWYMDTASVREEANSVTFGNIIPQIEAIPKRDFIRGAMSEICRGCDTPRSPAPPLSLSPIRANPENQPAFIDIAPPAELHASAPVR